MTGTIVIIRSDEECADLEEAIRAKGYSPYLEPVLKVTYTDNPLPDMPEDVPLVFTSANGVRAYAQRCESRARPVYAVGVNTAAIATEVGFSDVKTAAGRGQDLADMLSDAAKTGLTSAIYVRAEHISVDLKEILLERGIELQEFVAYAVNPAETLSLNLLKGLDNRNIEAIMFFSRRGGTAFANLCEQYDRAVRLKSIKALCLSEGVVQSVSVLPFEQALVAARPDRYGMMELLEQVSAKSLRK